jgi:molybdopterin synthase catalytic subunit
MMATPAGDNWVALTEDALSAGAVGDWAVRPDCGAVVVFSGTVRDHAEGRPGVSGLAYEAYAEQVEPRLAAIVDEARRQWPDLGRVALLHRIGDLALTESSVVVAVSSPHRPEAFAAARYCIDTLKASVPIWKRETWEGGEDWGLGAHDVAEIGQ